MKKGESVDNRYQLLVAINSDTHYQLDELINEALREQDYLFLYSEQPLSFTEYLQHNSDRQDIAVNLSKQLSEEQPIAFTQTAILHDINQKEGIEYLITSEYPIEPLKEQQDVPFWEQPWIDNALKELLFQPLHSSDGDPLKTYALVDATLYTQVRGVFDLDLRTDVVVKCLFKGKAQEQLKAAAPYVIDVSLDESNYSDNSRISKFHRDQFPSLWQRDAILFVKTSIDIDQLCDHLRRFTKISIDEKKPQFFRFWDPAVARDYFKHLKAHQQRVAKWFGYEQGEALIKEIIYRGYNDFSCIKLQSQNIAPNISVGGFSSNSYIEQQIFKRRAIDKFIDQIAPWIQANFIAHESLESEDLNAFYHHQITQLSSLGIRSKRAVSFILAAIYQTNHPVEIWHESFANFIQQTEMSQEMKAQQIAETLIQSLIEEPINERGD